MRAAAGLLFAALALAGCASLPRAAPLASAPATTPAAAASEASAPRVVVRKVRVSCVPPGLPPPPRYPDTDAALRSAAGAADRYQLLAAGRLLRAKRLAELERVIEACR